MPAFTFEKLSPSARRAPAASAEKKPRGFFSQMIGRVTDGRGKRRAHEEAVAADRRDAKPSHKA
jgi:hypothetical protein